MKSCPTCNRVETDETLAFCRLDGAHLVPFDGESATAVLPVGSRSGPGIERVTSRVSRPAKAKAIDSIAVLPFENVSNDPNTEYLSDGITENIINNLSQLPRLKVMARSTVFRYKGRQQIDPQRVGNELGVQAVVTSSFTSPVALMNESINFIGLSSWIPIKLWRILSWDGWLNRAYEIHDGWMIYITVDPRWNSLRGDNRFAEIVQHVGL